MSETAYPSRRSRFGQPSRPSSRGMIPLHRLDTLTEAPSVDMLDENQRRGTSRKTSSSSDSRIPAPRHQLHSPVDTDSGSADNLRNGHHEEEEEEEPSLPPPSWAVEPRDNATQNPLLRRPQWNPKK